MRNTTVSHLVQELLECGLVREESPDGEKRRGRPEFQLVPDFDRYTAISVHVRDRNLDFALININGDILYADTAKLPQSATNRRLERTIRNGIRKLRDSTDGANRSIGIELSLAGTVDRPRNIWVDSYRFPRIMDFGLEALSREFDTHVGVRRGLDAELAYQLARDPKSAHVPTLMFFWGFGIAASYSHEGRILESPSGRFADVGHTIVNRHSEKRCRCGQYGCVETEAAIYGILPGLRERYPDLREGSADIRAVISEPSVLDLGIVKNAIDVVEVCVNNLLKTMYPQRLYLTGPFFQNPAILDRVRERAAAAVGRYEHAMSIDVVMPAFERCKWGSLVSLFRQTLSTVLGDGTEAVTSGRKRAMPARLRD